MYLKYKDADPKDTIRRIRSVFKQVGIHVDCRTEKHIDGVYSSYLTDSACHWRTEGKGTTPEYCEASAYGEAMEHVCTHYAFDISKVSEHAKQYKGFLRYPDEQKFPVEKITELSPVILEELREPFLRLGRRIPEDEELIALWKKILKSDTTSFVPFYHVNQDKCVLLPDAVLSKLCGTNGGGCGNTPEEAIGHALDEVIERWCKYLIFSERMTPPEIPDAYVEKRCPDLYKLKKSIEKNGRLKVLILDASLGKNYPTACVVVIDPDNRRYLANFGCHPMFEIALERCFTEIFQDRRVVPELLERRDMSAWADFDANTIACQRNWAKLLEDDLGLWPAEFLGTDPTWEFSEWPAYDVYSNKIGMHSQLDRLLKDGAEVFIRNVGFLEFPVYRVYIKGLSVSHINYTEEILDDLAIIEKMQSFLNGECEREEMISFAQNVFGDDSILGRMFFYTLTNEEFDLLHAAFLMEYGDIRRSYDIIGQWNGSEAGIAKRIIELLAYMPLNSAVGCAKRFSTEKLNGFIDAFFSEKPFQKMLAYYGFSGSSRQSMSGESIRPERDDFVIKVKDYMSVHMVTQDDIRNVVL